MTEKVSICFCEHLPMPLIYLASAQDLARWQRGQMEWAYSQGHRDLAISFFDTTAMGFDTADAAVAVVATVMDFLCKHPDVEHLTIRCGNTDPQSLLNILSQYE